MALSVVEKFGDELKKTITLDQKVISDVCDGVIATMVNGLPEEAHTLEVYNYVLNESIELLKTKTIILK